MDFYGVFAVDLCFLLVVFALVSRCVQHVLFTGFLVFILLVTCFKLFYTNASSSVQYTIYL